MIFSRTEDHGAAGSYDIRGRSGNIQGLQSDIGEEQGQDQEQVDKFLELKDKLPQLRKVVYWDVKGMWMYEDPILISFTEVQEMGKDFERTNPGLFEKLIEEGQNP